MARYITCSACGKKIYEGDTLNDYVVGNILQTEWERDK